MITVYGASDDLIEVEGDIREEFYALGDDENFLALSNGTVLRVEYSRGGVWRITHAAGTPSVAIDQAPEGDDENYSDRATITDHIAWVVHGTTLVRWKSEPQGGRDRSDNG